MRCLVATPAASRVDSIPMRNCSLATGIAGMRHHRAIEAESASHDCGGHVDTARLSPQSGVQHIRVGCLDQAGQQGGQQLPRGRLAKAAEHALYGRAGGDFTTRLPTYAVSQRKQPAMRTGLSRRGRDYRSKVVLVVSTHSPWVGELSEFHIQHGAPSKQKADHPPTAAERAPTSVVLPETLLARMK